MKMQAATVPNLCPKFPIMPVNVTAEIEKLLDSYNVVNKPPTVATMQQIDLLIGGEYYNTIMHAPSSSVVCLPGSLRIHLTPFGGVLSGCSSAKTSISKKMHRTVTRAFMCMTKEDTKQLEAHDSLGIQPPTIQSTPTLWSLDCIGLNDPSVETSTKDFFDAFFRSTTVRLENGRYEVRLPFKSQNPQIDDNLSVAIRRLTSTVRKLSPDGSETEILRKYDDIFKDYLQSGKIEKVTKHEIDGLVVHYLSHFPVVRESRATTKVRIVLDPSLKTKNGVCLNDLLFTGSNLMEDLTGMLLRFRVPNFAITADIQAAFLAVSLAKSDRDAVRFLWLKDSTNTSLKNNIQIYRFRRVAFGLCCSPWLLNATVKLHLEQHESPMARKFDHQIYMDNAILMAQKPEDCVEIYKGSKQIFQEAEMNLREWHSNCPSFHSQIPKEDRATGTVIKVLGLLWNTVQDTIALQKPEIDQMVSTYPAQNDTYQVCLHGPGGLKLVIPPKQKCNYPPTCDKHKEVSVTLFTPTPFWPNTTAFFCYMEKVEICTYTGFFAGKGIVKPATISRTYVKKETCEQVVSSKQFNGTVLQPDKLFPQLFSTGKKLNVEYRWLETKCTKAENFIFETGEVSTKDGKHMVSNLQSTDHCHFSDGVCHSPEGTLIWSVKKFLHYCPYTRRGVYPATIDGDYVSVSSLQSAFHLGKQRGASIHNCLPKTSYLTKEGVVLFLGVFTKSQNEQIQRSFSVEEQNTTLQTMIDSLKLTENLDPLNSKLNFLVLKLTSSWQEAFRKEFYQLCILAQKEWDIIRQLIYLDATRGVRALLGREDVSADFRGNALIVHKCHAMKVDQINLNHQVPNNVKCFLFLPAKVNSEYWFLIPGTRDLVPSSPEVPCHQVSHGHPSQHRQEMKIEQLLQLFDPSSLTNRSTLAIFSAPALFKAKILHSPQLIRGYAGKIMETERRLAAVINYTAELSFQPNVIRETLNGVGDLLGNVITSTGGALGGILKDGLEGAGELTNAVMSPFVTVGLTIATILLIIGVCGFGFYQRKLSGGPGLPRTLRQAIRRSVPAKYRRKALKSQDTQTDDQET